MKTQSPTILPIATRTYKDVRQVPLDYITCSPRIKSNGMIGELIKDNQLYTQTKKRKADESN